MGSGALGAVLAASRLFHSYPQAHAEATSDVIETFGPAHVKKIAERLSQAEYVKPAIDLPAPFNNLSYDQYRDIRFRVDQSIWRGEKLDYELQLFPMGWLYDSPVDIWVVEGDRARQLKADGRLFSLGPLIGKGPEAAPFGFSGFRIHGPINRADYYDEFALFQGASYLRAVARNEKYGMSARGLAINTARPGGEEFPLFRSFWIEKPRAGAPEIVVHALLDSPSTAGAYRFAIAPGTTTVMDIEATLYPRKQIQHVGITPLTSMFLTGTASRRITGDFRPAIHDSEGLAILNGRGERLWRPLANPRMLQTSSFVDKDPKGFGLCQRDRSFDNFEDLEARYERRPTVWVEPNGAWGEGVVELIEIPAEEEIHDNIVAAWKPKAPLEPGSVYNYSYRLHWGEDIPVAWAGAKVAKTRIGKMRKDGVFIFVVDFHGPAVKDLRDLPVAQLTTSGGKVAHTVVQRHPDIGGVRVSFELSTSGSDLIELRLALKANEQLVSENWIYRWTK